MDDFRTMWLTLLACMALAGLVLALGALISHC